VDFGKGEGFPMATTTPNKEKKNKKNKTKAGKLQWGWQI
jgi:hypothetical protein